jgi:hypothetical protein
MRRKSRLSGVPLPRCDPLAERLDDARQQRQRAGTRGRMLLGIRDELLERFGIEIAIRHQA